MGSLEVEFKLFLHKRAQGEDADGALNTPLSIKHYKRHTQQALNPPTHGAHPVSVKTDTSELTAPIAVGVINAEFIKHSWRVSFKGELFVQQPGGGHPPVLPQRKAPRGAVFGRC
ncbi:hypothetical protein EYF80_004097 [Liparis tanakae]|uniref:Uncharacterized protein n=1 Tax=Liparis tanakae TaxID=230148 RepID=A0A4Z2J514_9TELE|nr:hypothetical protein EYF80_004097 [Liparis tanakae]